MQVYLVGGAVRDELLGLPVKERDWVVVGVTPEEMLVKGFYSVGKDFPVFLHPETKEEYALARTERKTGKGYTGFACHAAPDVSLEDDLERRDLTINAMAKTQDGKIIDPYGGQQDLKNKLLRHVSPAFAEDPVRILRLARFAARFAEFQTHPATLKLMQNMVAAGEVDALVAERVWRELERALQESQPQRFFQVLESCGAMAILFAQIQDFDTAMLKLERATKISTDPAIRFAAFLYDLDRDAIESICQRYRAPAEYRDLALLVIRNKVNFQNALQLNSEQLLQLLYSTDAFRRPQRFERFLFACSSDLSSAEAESRLQRLRKCLQVAQSVQVEPIIEQGLEGSEIAEELRKQRVKMIGKIK